METDRNVDKKSMFRDMEVPAVSDLAKFGRKAGG